MQEKAEAARLLAGLHEAGLSVLAQFFAITLQNPSTPNEMKLETRPPDLLQAFNTQRKMLPNLKPRLICVLQRCESGVRCPFRA